MSVELFLILVDVLANLKHFVGGVILLAFLGLAVLGALAILIQVTGTKHMFSKDVDDAVATAHLVSAIKCAVAVLIIAEVVHIAIPRKDTLYIVAGVSFTKDITSKLSDSAIYNKAMKLLEKQLDKALSNTPTLQGENT